MKFLFSFLVKIREKKNGCVKLWIVIVEKMIFLLSDIYFKNKIWVVKYVLFI